MKKPLHPATHAVSSFFGALIAAHWIKKTGRRNLMRNAIGVLCLSLTLFGTVLGQCSDKEKMALESFDRAWGTAGETGDKAALNSIYADDYVGLPGMQGKAATIEDTMKSVERDKANPAMADKVTHDQYMITCTPNTATITHRNIIWTPNGLGGKPETYWTRSVHFLEKRGGKWQVVSNAGNDMDDYMILGYMERDWNDAILKRDKAWFAKNYAEDFSSVSSTTANLMNKAEDVADTMNDKVTTESISTTNMNIRIDGKVGIVTGIFHTKGKDEKGAPFDRKMRFTDTWIKRDGRWQVWATQGTNIP
ncbi:MAG: nuclear transport factor 2 family protein [Acidobacteria bacterium]|nr:nuclear transport factor 2 family protein [Acidobacteriota bacterium]